MDNSNKIILDLCGGTGAWSKPYRDNGYDVRNITLPEYDIRTYKPPANVYGILAAPPCTEFSWANAKKPRNLRIGMETIISCLNIIWECQYRLNSWVNKKTVLKFWALENPYGFLNQFLGHPVLIFNPYDFSNNYKKKTCLWGYFNIPKKKPIKCTMPKFDKMRTKDISPENYGKYNRQVRRAITPSGFALAFYEANK